MGSVSVGGSATKLGSAVKLGSVPIKLGSAAGGGRSFTASVEEEVIRLDVSRMTDKTLPTGGKKESDMRTGIQHLKDNRATMDLDPKDFRIFTY